MPADHAVTIVTLTGGRVGDAPLLYADDLAALRGDGVFETLLVRDGAACLLDAHLQRLARSAELMDLPAPDLSRWRRRHKRHPSRARNCTGRCLRGT